MRFAANSKEALRAATKEKTMSRWRIVHLGNFPSQFAVRGQTRSLEPRRGRSTEAAAEQPPGEDFPHDSARFARTFSRER